MKRVLTDLQGRFFDILKPHNRKLFERDKVSCPKRNVFVATAMWRSINDLKDKRVAIKGLQVRDLDRSLLVSCYICTVRQTPE